MGGASKLYVSIVFAVGCIYLGHKSTLLITNSSTAENFLSDTETPYLVSDMVLPHHYTGSATCVENKLYFRKDSKYSTATSSWTIMVYLAILECNMLIIHSGNLQTYSRQDH